MLKTKQSAYIEAPKVNLNYELYSFDIFDTIITRTTATPTGIFAIMQEKLKTSNALLSVPDYVKENFFNIRVESELFLRRHFSNYEINEVTFDDIYNHLKNNFCIDDKDIELLKALEIETEIKNAVPIPVNINKLIKYKEDGKRVILISDMYHSSDTIRKILVNINPIFSDIPIYVSSEIRQSKRNGLLYKYISQKEENIKLWCHIGDNMKSDVEIAKKYGINSQHFRYCGLYPYEKILINKYPEDVYSQIAVGTARNVRLFCRKNEKFNLGCDMGGVILYPYINWIVNQAEKRGIKRLYFVMRDGYTLKNLCDILMKQKGLNIQTKLIYGSREAWRVPSITSDNSNLKFMFASPREINTTERIASRFHIREEDLFNYLPEKFKNPKEVFSKKKLMELSELLSNNDGFINLVIEANKEQREFLIEYIKQEIDLSDDNFAFVDLAASGRTQNCFAKIIKSIKNLNVKSMYSQFNGAKLLTADIDMFAFHSSTKAYSQFELFCRCMSGATIAYKKDGAVIVPVQDDIEGEKLKEYNYEDVLLGEKAFFEEFCKTIKINGKVVPNLKAITCYFDYILGKPDANLAELIGEIPFSNYYGVEKKAYKCAPILTLKDVIFGYDATQIQLPNISYIRSSKCVKKFMDIKKKYGSLRKFFIHLEIHWNKKIAFMYLFGIKIGLKKLIFGRKK